MSGGRHIFNDLTVYIYFVICFMDLYLANTKTIRLQKRYTEKDICHESEKTLVKVYACPTNSTMFTERSHKKNCDIFPKCMRQQLVYHCVKFEEQFVEVCALISYIRGYCCALYDKGLGRVIEDFNRRCPECDVQYLSNNYEQAAICEGTSSNGNEKLKRKKRDCLEGEKHDSIDKIHAVSTENVTSSNQTDIKNKEINNGEQLNLSIIVPVVVSVTILLLAITIAFCQRKNPKRMCIVTRGGMKNFKENQNKLSLQITDPVLLENKENCKMLPNNT